MKRLLYFILVILLLPTCTEQMVETTGDVYGTVQDAKTGNPLDNCNVVLNPSGLSTTTGSNGSFRFVYVEGGEYSLQASRSEYITNSTNVTIVPGCSVRTDLLLTDEASTRGRIRGAVVDADTQMPLRGCLVVLLPGNQSKVTDEWGTFHFENLTPGEYSIRVTRDKYLEQVKYDVQVQASTETSVQFLLYDESSTKGTITGVVRDSGTNAVLEECLVTLQPGGVSKLTDSEGRFSFGDLTPNEYEITITRKGYFTYTKKMTAESGKIQSVEILLSKESVTKGGISGTVRDYETNAVLEECLVTLQPGGTSQLTDSEGNFSFEELAPTEYELTVTKKGYSSYTKKVIVEPDKTQSVEILLSKESATKGGIVGTVRDYETNVILEGCLVTLQPSGASKLTDSEGSFSFEDLAPTEYEITVTKKDYSSYMKKVTVEQGKNQTIEILLPKESVTKGDITGTVRDYETNAVLEGCLVTLQPGGASKLTDPEGDFNFEELAPAEYEIAVTKKDYSSYTKRVTVEPGKTQTVEILLYKESATKGSITGTVRDDETNAVMEGCLVTLQPGGASKLTDPKGEFRFEELAPAEYEITVTKKDYLSYAKRATVESGKTQTVEILLTKESATKGSVAGIVKNAETQVAIAHCKVTLVETGANVETDDSGAFGFENLDPGTYSLRFEKDSYLDQSKTGIVVQAKEETSVQVFMKEISSEQRPPVFGAVSASNISAGSARLNGTLSDEGSSPVTERGFLVSRTSDPRSDHGAIRVRAAGSGTGNFYGMVSGLSASTLYYACAYAATSSETAYSDAISFMTLNQGDVSVPSNVICVSLSGDDNNDGSAWTSSKRTIGAAIKSAKSGQEIWVALGSYSEMIAPSDGIPVYGGFKGSEKTINDRQPGSRTSVRGISCDVYTRETVIDGFKVSGGSGVKLQDYAILRNCEICNNTYNVVTVSCERKSCIIENCSIYGNTLKSGTSGAVTTARTGAVTLVNCFLQGNDQGPAIYNAGYVKTINCVIANNYEGVRSWGASADFINTTFAGNRNFALAVNNDVQLYNCIVWDDRILNYEGNSISITLESCVHEPDVDNSAILFVSPVAYGDDWTKADWSLSSGSSCIDSGVNIFYAIDEDPYDIAGNPRISNGTIDIGAYEYQR